MEKIKNKIIDFIKKQAGDKPVVLGLSGGLDSSIVAYLTVEALGANKVQGVIMPSDTNTDEELKLAETIVKNLHLKSYVLSLEPILNSFKKTIGTDIDRKTIGNLKARTRMTLLYSKANELNGLVLGTGNKTELMIGYFTKYGDGGADLLPIGDLYKTEERELAKYLGIPQEIIDRPPTAGLWEGQTDEEEIGLTYEVLDKILMALESNESLDEFKTDDIEKVKQMIKDALHKINIPPICKINSTRIT